MKLFERRFANWKKLSLTILLLGGLQIVSTNANAGWLYHEGYVCSYTIYSETSFGLNGTFFVEVTSKPWCEGETTGEGFLFSNPEGYQMEHPEFNVESPDEYFKTIDLVKNAANRQSRVMIAQDEDLIGQGQLLFMDFFADYAPPLWANCQNTVTGQSSVNGVVVATCDNPTDMGIPGNNITISANSCAQIFDGFETSWNSQNIKLELTAASAVPINFTYTNACGGVSGYGSFSNVWDAVYIPVTDSSCPTTLSFAGDAADTITVRYWQE